MRLRNRFATLFGRRVHTYATYFDQNYAARGLVMLCSLLRHDPAARIIVLGFDPLVRRIVADAFGERLTIVGTEELHAADPGLGACADRTPWELFATHKPVLARYALARYAAGSLLFIDADTAFFSDPAPLFAEIGKASIAVSPHRFDAAAAHLAQYGSFNAGCIYWRNDKTGQRCLADWRNDCLAWCHERVEPDGRFMNQGYLNRWPEHYDNVRVITHPGVNLAPWNVDAHTLLHHDGRVTVDGTPLIFYHFSGVVQDTEGSWYSWYPDMRKNLALAREAIYGVYLSAVEATARALLRDYGVSGTGSVRKLPTGDDAILLRGPAI